MTTRMKWLVGVLVVVTIGAAIYFSILFSPPAPAGFNFFGNATSTATLPQAPNVPKKGSTGATTPKGPAGYAVAVHGKTETITSTAAGASLDAPVNATIAQTNGVLSVTPPSATAGETLRIQKSTGSFPNAFSQIPSLVSGTDNGFAALHNAPDSSAYNPSNIAGPAHIQKLRNRTVSNYPAVEMHITASAVEGTTAQDFYLTWVRTGSTNWYIVRTATGVTALTADALDTMFSSITLTP